MALLRALARLLPFGLAVLLPPSVSALPDALPGYRGLAHCPDLAPLSPEAPRARPGRRCRDARAEAARSWLGEVLAAHERCLSRVHAGDLAGDPESLCRGRLLSSTGTRALPEDATANALETAAARLRERLAGACPGDDPEPLLAELREHVQHALEQSHGALGAVDPRALACQAAVSSGARRFLLAHHDAIVDCVEHGPGNARGRDAARTCLGAFRAGRFEPPRHPPTAARLARARASLERQLAGSCDAGAVAALDTCASTPTGLAGCLVCTQAREATLLAQSMLGGRPEHATTHFVDWERLRNPILALPDRMLKDQAVAFQDGRFYVFASTRFEPDDPGREHKIPWFFRTRDFVYFDRLWDPDLNPPGGGPGSPDLVRIDGLWHLVFQAPSPVFPANRQLYLTTSHDLEHWSPVEPLAPDLQPEQSLIDGALAPAAGGIVLGYKWRQLQSFQVTRSVGPGLDGRFLPPRRSLAETPDFVTGFVENYQFLRIDGAWRMLATSRDPDLQRCGSTSILSYTCSHEPFLFSLSGDGSRIEHWAQWRRKTLLRVPYEDWNPIMHANSGFLADWREHDGFFYLFYAGSDDGERFEGRGHGKLGVARSRDLLHWRVAGDLRD